MAKLSQLEREMAEEKGALTFCALMKPTGSMDDWEFLVSATWAVWENFDPIEYIVDKIYRDCPDEERMLFSRVAIIDTTNPDLDDILEDFDVEHGLVKMQYGHYFQQEFERGYVFTAKARSQAAKERLASTS